MIQRAAIAATGAVAAVTAFALMDANPSLYLYDKLWATKRRRLHHFQGQRIWLIGASSGIGATLSLELAASGADLVLSGRSVENLRSVADACRDRHPEHGSAQVVPLDVTCSERELEQAMHLVLGEGDFDCVIFNAGIRQLSPALEATSETHESLLRVNALGPMNIASLIMRKSNWLQRRRGQFVLTSSVAAKGGVPLSAAYAASKHAIHGYMLSLKAEHPWLRVTLPCPGPVATNFDKTHIPTKGELKMSTRRCAQLMVSSIMMGDGETWIAEQPTLTYLYLSQFAPSVARRILNVVGPIRMDMWRQGLNVYDPKDMKTYRKQQRRSNTKDVVQ